MRVVLGIAVLGNAIRSGCNSPQGDFFGKLRRKFTFAAERARPFRQPAASGTGAHGIVIGFAPVLCLRSRTQRTMTLQAKRIPTGVRQVTEHPAGQG